MLPDVKVWSSPACVTWLVLLTNVELFPLRECSGLSLRSRSTLCCMKSSCCGWAESRGRWTPTGSPCSASPQREACWPSQRPESYQSTTKDKSSSLCGGPQTKARGAHDRPSQTETYAHWKWLWVYRRNVTVTKGREKSNKLTITQADCNFLFWASKQDMKRPFLKERQSINKQPLHLLIIKYHDKNIISKQIYQKLAFSHIVGPS